MIVPDEEDAATCDGSPWCSDCNDNGNLDTCDIRDGISEDANENDIPDECDLPCVVPPGPLPDPRVSVHFGFGTRNRYVCFVAAEEGHEMAIRVVFDYLPADYEEFEGDSWWVTQPYLVSEASG